MCENLKMLVQNLGYVCESKNGRTNLMYVNLKMVAQNLGYVCESKNGRTKVRFCM